MSSSPSRANAMDITDMEIIDLPDVPATDPLSEPAGVQSDLTIISQTPSLAHRPRRADSPPPAHLRATQPPPVLPYRSTLPVNTPNGIDAFASPPSLLNTNGNNAQDHLPNGGQAHLQPPYIVGNSRRRSSEIHPSTNLQLESADDMVLRLSNEFQPVVESNWDTVIYIGPPPQEHQQDDHEYSYIKQHFSKSYLMNSQTLKDVNSAKFSRFLGPMSARAERRLKKLGIHHQIPQDRKPKYYIDLRPMQDDDEALLMITELTCTHGVLSWHMSHLAGGVPRTVICGKDNLNITSKPHAKSWIEVDDNAVDDFNAGNDGDTRSGSDDADDRILDLEAEYSALRHYTAIERLLHAIAGNDPKLNSAPKVWTYVAIAKFFDCATNARINAWVYNWLFVGNNNNFIQANPEVAYRMALSMRSPDILRTSYAMLVGERALMQADRHDPESSAYRPAGGLISVHGRTLCHLDDDEINRLDHAAQSLARRVVTSFRRLSDNLLDWTTARSELNKFLRLLQYVEDEMANDKEVKDEKVKDEEMRDAKMGDSNSNNLHIVQETFDLLRAFVKGEIYQALSRNVGEGDLMRLYRAKGVKEFNWLKRSKSFADSYNIMPLPQRLLTQSFWSQLENCGLYQDVDQSVAWTHGHCLAGLSDLEPEFNGSLECVSKRHMFFMIDQMNGVVRKEKRKKQWKLTAARPQASLNQGELNSNHSLGIGNEEVVRAAQGVYDTAGRPLLDLEPQEVGSNDWSHPRAEVAHGQRDPGMSGAIKPALLLAELTMAMRGKIMREVLTPGYIDDEIGIESEISISQMDILLCLTEDEWKYLPLWAGGLDDGSGGVFAELDVPDMDAMEGFRGGKMGLHDLPGGEGSVGGSFSMAGDSDDFDQVMTDEGVSTVGKASRLATDGTTSAGGSTVMSLDD